jgi:hypothetical protein
MIRIGLTEAAFEAVAILPLGRVIYEPLLSAQGERLIWVEARASKNSRPCAAPARATATSSCGWSKWRRTALNLS